MQALRAIAACGVWCLGAGYIVLWAVTGPLYRTLAIDVRPETLPPVLHMLGLIAAALVVVRALAAAVRPGREPPVSELPLTRRRFRRPDPTVKRVKARDHFGLRGLQQ